MILAPIFFKTCRNPEPLAKVENLWRSVGAETVVMEAECHDFLVARTSHLPHLLAGALVALVQALGRKDARIAKLVAGSFRDMTRIADSDPVQWAQISAANQGALLDALQTYQKILGEIARKVQQSSNPGSSWKTFFASAKTGRQRLFPKS